jgi:type VI secretion system protein ImpE
MSAYELLQSGRLSEALARQTELVRAHPTDVDARYLLFALLALSGELERASAALNVIAQREKKLETTTILLRSLLAAEDERRRVFTEEGEPLLPPDAPDHMRARLGALLALRRGDPALAEKELDAADAVSPHVCGTLNGQPFHAARDDDDLLASVIEAFAGGRYMWIALERIKRLRAEAPKRLIDNLWISASLDLVDGTSATVFLPSLYVGSHAHADDLVRIGRRTEWQEIGGGRVRGLGQRLLAAASGDEVRECPILELRELALATDA